MLRRSMGLIRATAMVVGIIIGASIFVQPSEVSRHVSTTRAMFGVWAAAGIMSIAGALVSAALASRFPKTGGVYVYLKETISPSAAFLWGWAMFWSAHSGIIAAIATVFARYAAVLVPMSDFEMRSVAIGCILLLSIVNYFGVRAGSGVQTAFTIAKLAAIAGILAAAAILAPPQVHSAVVNGPHGMREFLLGISAGLFAFGGWHMVTYAAGETINAPKTIPRALFIGMTIVTVCYLSLNGAYLRILPLNTVLQSQHVAADAASVMVGSRGAALVAVLVLISAFGGLSGTVLAGPRVYYAIAQDGLAWRAMGNAHPRFQTPHLAILAQAVWASSLVATGTYRVLFTRVVYTEFLFFALMTIGLMRLEKRATPTGLVFLLGCTLVVGNQLVSDWKESAIGLLIVAAGLPVYYFLRSRKNAHY
ncbi:MAG TPA: amino acid permease [Bryobacteraceae bacterium]|nr:amino acid permease [Bryobacteraceae bacterium]